MGCSYMQVLHGGNHHGGCGRCHHIYIYIYIYGEFALWCLLAAAGDQLRVFRWAVKN
jgi:hypothetical protein